MSATYTRAIVPKCGDVISSRVAISAARAMGDRMKLGPCIPWRLVFLLFSAFRQIRNPDASRYLFPSLGEFLEFYQMLDPHDAQWPVAGPGEPEGANVVCTMASFVFGVDVINFPSESDRLSEGDFQIEADDQEPETLWRLAQRQRGAIDPATGDTGAPAINAANSQAYIRQSQTSPHGKAFGDYLPGPEFLGKCLAPNDDRPSQTLIFTKLDGSLTTETFGTCPEIPGSSAGVVYTPFVYIIFLWDGGVVVLPKNQWIEGPYTSNPALRKTDSNFIDQALNKAISDFRGTAVQREGATWNGEAFDTQAVLTTQYHLAPQKGTVLADGTEVAPTYPLFRIRPAIGSVSAGTVLPLVIGEPGSTYSIDPGFVCASAFLSASGLRAETTVKVSRDGVALGTATLTPDENGDAAALLTFSRPKAGGGITVALGGVASFAGATRELSVEITELLEYKPGLQDLYLMLRCGGVKFDTDLDGTGEQCEFAKEISRKYLASGVITSIEGHVALPGTDASINSNAIFDAARRLSQCVRVMPRDNFTGIAVQDSKTILWFKRWARGLRHDTPIDLFGGIAPAPDDIPNGSLVLGKRYKVSTASILYNQHAYKVGDIFTAVKDIPGFDGSGKVFEADGVYDAFPANFSNQWLMGVKLIPYNDNEASEWKPSVFSDYWTMQSRCLFGDPAIGRDTSGVLLQVAYGQSTSDGVINPEAPDSFNYVPTFGTAGVERANEDATKDFYQSCGLMEPWPQPLSVELDGDEIKVTFATFHHDEVNDTADFARDPSTWNLTDLRAEPFRTWRNGLREYMVFQATGWESTVKTGDQAFNSTLQTNPDAPYGAIFPTFMWTQLPPEPFEDGNETQDAEDAPLYHDLYAKLDLYIRAGCEAFVDGELTTANACAHGTTDLYGFTIENLLFKVTGGRGFPVLPTAATDLIPVADTRPDQPEFHGPLPNTIVSAEVAANIARALNELTTFRVMIPCTLQCRVGVASGDEFQTSEVNARGESVNGGAPAGYGSSGHAVYVNGGPAGVGSMDYTTSPGHDWADIAGGDSAILNAYWLIAFQGSPLGVHNVSQQMQADFRWVGIGDAIYTLPVGIRELLTDSPAVFGEVVSGNGNITKSVVVGDHNGTQSHTAGDPSDDIWSLGTGGAGQAVLWINSTSGASDVCQQIHSGSFATGPAPGGIAWDSSDAFGRPTVHRDGPSRQVVVTLFNATTPAITVPLVDLP